MYANGYSVGIKAPADLNDTNITFILPDSTNTANGTSLVATNVTNNVVTLGFGTSPVAVSNYFATSGLSNKDLGVGLHIKTGDSGVSSVQAGYDELVIEGSADAGISVLSGTSNSGGIRFGDSGNSNIGGITYLHTDNSMNFITNGTGRMTIDSSGRATVDNRLTIGGTGDNSSYKLNIQFAGNTQSGIHLNDTYEANNATFLMFRVQGTEVGNILRNGSNNSVNYNTTSDYRLKELEESITDGVARLKQLKPYKFNWKSNPDGNKVDGFFAHEVSSVVPEAITGEKDGEKMQSIDQSKLVPLLVAAVQELTTRLEALEN